MGFIGWSVCVSCIFVVWLFVVFDIVCCSVLRLLDGEWWELVDLICNNRLYYYSVFLLVDGEEKMMLIVGMF